MRISINIDKLMENNKTSQQVTANCLHRKALRVFFSLQGSSGSCLRLATNRSQSLSSFLAFSVLASGSPALSRTILDRYHVTACPPCFGPCPCFSMKLSQTFFCFLSLCDQMFIFIFLYPAPDLDTDQSKPPRSAQARTRSLLMSSMPLLQTCA